MYKQLEFVSRSEGVVRAAQTNFVLKTTKVDGRKSLFHALWVVVLRYRFVIVEHSA